MRQKITVQSIITIDQLFEIDKMNLNRAIKLLYKIRQPTDDIELAKLALETSN